LKKSKVDKAAEKLKNTLGAEGFEELESFVKQIESMLRSLR